MLALLLICIILTCWKRKGSHSNLHRTMVPGIGILPHKTLTCHGPSRRGSVGGGDSSSKLDKRAMIDDTCSETSEDSCQLPYVTRKVSFNFVVEKLLFLLKRNFFFVKKNKNLLFLE